MYPTVLLSSLVFTIGLLGLAECQTLSCPAVRTSSGWLDLFPIPCKKHSECRTVMGKHHLCCKGFCTKGVNSPAAPIKLGVKSNLIDVSSTNTSTTTSTSTTTTSTTTTTTTTTTTPSTTSSTTTTTTTTPRPATEPPPRPFFQLLPIQTTQAAKTKSSTKTGANQLQKLVCPKSGQAPLVLFPIPCENSAQCRPSSGADHVCCENRCVKGVPAPRPVKKPRSHQPLLGVIPRECPTAPLGELLFEVQSCKSDADCWPRVCCPDGARSFCRTARARLDLLPVANQIDGPVRMLEQYLQCTPPPKADLFPQRCSSSVDCFPNLCCAENGQKFCRPPQRSLLALLTGVSQRVGSTLGNLRLGAAQNNKI